jgi:tetratricopeptide (TPR) repeat protein
MDKYLDTRNNIRLLYDTKQYIKCIAACTSFLETLENIEHKNDEIKYNIWFIYKRMSVIYCKFKKFDNAMDMAKKAMKYQTEEIQYYLIIWLMALILETTNKKRSIKLYDKCICYFRKNKQENYLMSVVRNRNSLIAVSNNNIKLLFWVEDINTFNNKANILEYIHNNAYNFALNIIDKLIDLTNYRVVYATI